MGIFKWYLSLNWKLQVFIGLVVVLLAWYILKKIMGLFFLVLIGVAVFLYWKFVKSKPKKLDNKSE